MRHILISICLIFLSGNLFSQSDVDHGLHSEGGPWQFFPLKERNDTVPDVLLIGDSVMNGFHQSVIDSLKEVANVDYWLTPKHLKSDYLLEDLATVVSFRKYQVIQFNIGLHGWPKGRIGEDEYVPLLEKYVQTIKENASNSILVWASTTPVTEQDKPALNAEINPTIVKRNHLADSVMNVHDVAVNDLYGLVEKKLHLARLDRFHWKSGGYQLMANQSISYILSALKFEPKVPTLSDYNVVWDSLSINSLGSMPAGNGDIGINLWVEKNGDLLFYLSKTDAWSENARLLKIGKVRLSLLPNPFQEDNPFLQELIVEDGVIHIEAGKEGNQTTIDVWVDANDPVVEIDVKSETAISAKVTTEPWRTQRRKLEETKEMHSAYGLLGDGGPEAYVEKDSILAESTDDVVWLHRNERSIWKQNLELQSLAEFADKNQDQDPLLNRTFGALIHSDKLEKEADDRLSTIKPLKEFSASVFVLTAQTEELQDWVDQITSIAFSVDSKSRPERLGAHKDWWNAYWDRSYINVSTQKFSDQNEVFKVAKGYTLQRYVNACSGRGNSPIKFNGSIFTVDTKNLDNRFGGIDADYRQWGGPFWWQNTRLPYWSMLESGDFDMMLPLFQMYRKALSIRKEATKTYYNHEGAFFPETMYFWGAFTGSNYGWDRSELPVGMTKNRYIRYYWQSGLEVSLMMLDYYSFTKDEIFLKETLLPVVTEIINFYDQHWGRDKNGKILFDPAMALETYNTAINPLPEIVGINKVCAELLKIPSAFVNDTQVKAWSRLIEELPEIPMQEVDGEMILAPAYDYCGKQNVENPELYAIFPYRRFGVGKGELKMARSTFNKRAIKETGGWQQNAIKAALLGLTEEAAKLTSQNFNAGTSNYRFPTMWGPNYDWTPDQCHGTVAMSALQRMLVQYDGDNIYLLPAWPKDWNTSFKLAAPYNTTVEGEVKDGKLIDLIVLPEIRRKDIVNLLNTEE